MLHTKSVRILPVLLQLRHGLLHPAGSLQSVSSVSISDTISPCDISYEVLPYLPLKNFTSAFLETVDLSYSSIPNSRYDTRISTAPGSKFFCLYSSISTFFVIPCSITSFCIFSGSLARVRAADFSISPSLYFSIASGSKFLEICWYSCTVAVRFPFFLISVLPSFLSAKMEGILLDALLKVFPYL